LFANVEEIPLKELDSNQELLQSGFWGAFKSRFGWQARGVRAKTGSGDLQVLVLLRPIKAGFSLVYIPYGLNQIQDHPDRESLLIDFAQKLKSILPKKTVFIRYDLPWAVIGKDNIPAPLCCNRSFKKAATHIQPLSTVVLDIRPGEERILSQMKHKTRYNIRLALRKGVEVVETDRQGLSQWYALYRETCLRDRISIHSFDYYNTLFLLSEEYQRAAPAALATPSAPAVKAAPPVPAVTDVPAVPPVPAVQPVPAAPQLKLFLAKIEGEVVAGIIVAFKDKTASYMYGASSDRKRNYMPNHALQWRGIQKARELGCERYDFCGIPQKEDKKDPMYGLYRFKTGFGGTILNRYGCYDVILREYSYFVLKQAETLRNFYFKVFKKRFLPG
jgi:lipid II:glycine glycyltransferase (peptidoglycan interpeptide bridge formation enzyme)